MLKHEFDRLRKYLEWRPISTFNALDYTSVILLGEFGRREGYRVKGEFFCVTRKLDPVKPTHWLPLPPVMIINTPLMEQ